MKWIIYYTQHGHWPYSWKCVTLKMFLHLAHNTERSIYLSTETEYSVIHYSIIKHQHTTQEHNSRIIRCQQWHRRWFATKRKIFKKGRITSINLQGEHKIFPWMQTFITRKLRGTQTYFLLPLLVCVVKKLLELSYILKKFVFYVVFL